MNIKEAKEEIKNAMTAYFSKDEFGEYEIPIMRQRPIFLMGPPGIGKTAIMEQIAAELGVGIISTAHRVGEATKEAMDAAIESMTTLNKYAAQCCKKYDIHGCTDITGFGFLGHLHEMVDGKLSCRVYADQMPVFPEALEYADEFLLTAVGQQNRNHAGRHIRFDDCISFAMQEVLFDPQSSGGLMIVLPADQAESLLADIQALGVPAAIVGEMLEPQQKEIYVTNLKK